MNGPRIIASAVGLGVAVLAWTIFLHAIKTGRTKGLLILMLSVTLLFSVGALAAFFEVFQSPLQVKTVEEILSDDSSWRDQYVSVRGDLRCDLQQTLTDFDPAKSGPGFFVPLLAGNHTALFVLFTDQDACRAAGGKPLTGMLTNITYHAYEKLQPLIRRLNLRTAREGTLLEAGRHPSDALPIALLLSGFACLGLVALLILRYKPHWWSAQ